MCCVPRWFTAETNCVCNQTRNPWLKELMEEPCWRSWWRSRAEGAFGGADGGAELMEVSCWRPCLVEGLPGEGRLSWGRWSLTLKWSSHSLPLLVEYCYHKLPAFVPYIPDNYICFTTFWSKTSAVCSRPGICLRRAAVFLVSLYLLTWLTWREKYSCSFDVR